jgi:hypothetical protein
LHGDGIVVGKRSRVRGLWRSAAAALPARHLYAFNNWIVRASRRSAMSRLMTSSASELAG